MFMSCMVPHPLPRPFRPTTTTPSLDGFGRISSHSHVSPDLQPWWAGETPHSLLIRHFPLPLLNLGLGLRTSLTSDRHTELTDTHSPPLMHVILVCHTFVSHFSWRRGSDIQDFTPSTPPLRGSSSPPCTNLQHGRVGRSTVHHGTSQPRQASADCMQQTMSNSTAGKLATCYSPTISSSRLFVRLASHAPTN